MTRLLIVDDDQSIRALVEWTVTADFDSVVQAVDGLDGLTAAAREKPDIVMLDLDMPRLGGVEACRTLRALETMRNVPIIILTAHGTTSDVQGALAAGASDFLVKPFSPYAASRAPAQLAGASNHLLNRQYGLPSFE